MVDNCIREYRVKRGWTQQQLADKVDGVNQPRIAAWE
ncbi:helix-turn-helix domain-containing protein, partial [Streptococcus parasanguinis]|nr:helix-turn-helix domain-containing protein [Streptococcus parasanguinis]